MMEVLLPIDYFMLGVVAATVVFCGALLWQNLRDYRQAQRRRCEGEVLHPCDED